MSKRDDNEARSGDGMPTKLAQEMRGLRDRIDELDVQIVRLLNQRAEHALELGRLKEQAGLETYQPKREIEVLAHARRVNNGPLEAGAITRLFERIIDENRRLERLSEGSSEGS